MSTGNQELTRQTWGRITRAVRNFLASGEGRRALWMLVGLIALLASINGLNVLNSYVGRDFISAIEHRNMSGFFRQAWLLIAVFAFSTVTAVLYSYIEQRLGLLWREWQTRQLLAKYLVRRAYYRLSESGELQNPDQRIAEDVRNFTTVTMSFVLMAINGLFTVVAFSGVLWSISPRLLGVAVVYAVTGSLLTYWLGKRLIDLNGVQLDREANFRSELMQVRENAESVAVLHLESHVNRRVLQKFDQLVGNTRRMIAVNRNLGFFTNGYNYLIQILPALIVAPLFMRGEVEFGVITQSAMAFVQLMGAFSIAITQFQSISSYAATMVRLGRLMDAIDDIGCLPHQSQIEIREMPGRLVFERLTLCSPGGRVQIKELSLSFERGSRVLIAGSSGHAKVALFKATAGLRCNGEGVIIRPDAEGMVFLPERPYLPKSTLRETLLQPSKIGSTTDAEINDALGRLHLNNVAREAGGLDVERDWSSTVGISEQARLLIARSLLAKPEFIFLDRMSSALDPAQAQEVLKLIAERGISYLVFGKREDLPGTFNAVIDLAADGSWTQQTLKL